MRSGIPEFRKMIERKRHEFQKFFRARKKAVPSHSDIPREYVDRHDVVLGSPKNELGWTRVVINVREPVAATIVSRMTQDKTVGAIPCSCAEEAAAMVPVFGDKLLDGLRP